MKTAIFLGAGASKAEGAPLQGELFREYFKRIRSGGNKYDKIHRDLMRFFKTYFNLNLSKGNLDGVLFPTFEEALGIVDLAEIRGESLRGLEIESVRDKRNRVRWTRQCLVLMLAKVIADSVENAKGLHQKLISALDKNDLLSDTIFISSNYDILIDNPITYLFDKNDSNTYHKKLDYGVDFTNFEDGSWERPEEQSIKLFKIHGSLNWLYCPTCNSLTLTPKEKRVASLITEPSKAKCKFCNTLMGPLIVPPTYFKNMSNVFLSNIWNKTEHSLRIVDQIIFCGYSFPEADMHIKYLMKRSQTNRRGNKLLIRVINHYPGKDCRIAEVEEERYKRFFGEGCVEYTKKSFEDFVREPLRYLRTK